MITMHGAPWAVYRYLVVVHTKTIALSIAIGKESSLKQFVG
jgi:hypothetical protein